MSATARLPMAHRLAATQFLRSRPWQTQTQLKVSAANDAAARVVLPINHHLPAF